jgi:hypothetical protein
MCILAILACVVVAVLAIPPAHAETTVELVATWPAGETVTLSRNQTFYLHLRYTSDQPVQIWARPYFQGKPAHAGSNPSRTYPPGSGEALGWFFLDPGAVVDEVRIRAGDGSPNGTHVVASYRVAVSGGDASTQAGAPPAWVTTLRAADKAAQDSAYQEAMNRPVSAGETLFFTGFMLLMAGLGLFGLLAPAWGLWRWRGGWRIAAAAPAVVMGFVVLRILVGTSIDPTSHNLWPFEILMVGAASTVFMIVLMVARKVTGAGRGLAAR